MRTLTVGTRNYTVVDVLDEPTEDGACHEYQIKTKTKTAEEGAKLLALIKFQNGPIKEAGVNGVHHEDLLAIIVDRLQGFQNGRFRCRENAIALTKIEEALYWLGHRTRERENRGVEGTHTT